MKLLKITLILALVLISVAPALAVLVPLSVDMDGFQANAGLGTGSLGVGTATITLDTDSNSLSWVIVWSGLTGTPTAMHFHGPALPNQNAGVQVGTGVVGPPVVGNAILSANQVDDLLAGLWYLNLHTDEFPGGEIRGTVITDVVSTEAQAWGWVKALFK